MIKKILV